MLLWCAWISSSEAISDSDLLHDESIHKGRKEEPLPELAAFDMFKEPTNAYLHAQAYAGSGAASNIADRYTESEELASADAIGDLEPGDAALVLGSDYVAEKVAKAHLKHDLEAAAIEGEKHTASENSEAFAEAEQEVLDDAGAEAVAIAKTVDIYADKPAQTMRDDFGPTRAAGDDLIGDGDQEVVEKARASVLQAAKDAGDKWDADILIAGIDSDAAAVAAANFEKASSHASAEVSAAADLAYERASTHEDAAAWKAVSDGYKTMPWHNLPAMKSVTSIVSEANVALAKNTTKTSDSVASAQPMLVSMSSFERPDMGESSGPSHRYLRGAESE